jgi:hypothetical protein
MDFRFDTITMDEQLTGSAQGWRRQCQPTPLGIFHRAVLIESGMESGAQH